MRITGTEGDFITINEASVMTNRYRVQNTSNHVTGHLFGKDQFMKILNQPNCCGVRIYHGFNDANERALVVVAVDGAGNDMHTGLILDRSLNCPPLCSTLNALNS
jgi:hypothetical protein